MPGPCILSCITLIGTVSISEDGEGRITGIYLPNSNLPCMEDGETDVLLEAADQLNEYFSGKRRRFDLPLDYGGTEFRTSVLEALIPLLAKYGFRSIRYIGNSYFDGSFVHERYGRRWIRKVDRLGLAHVTYSSSVNTFCRNKAVGNPALMEQEAVEVYVHPVLVTGHLIDNYTGGVHLEEGLARAGLDSSQFITSRDL